MFLEKAGRIDFHNTVFFEWQFVAWFEEKKIQSQDTYVSLWTTTKKTRTNLLNERKAFGDTEESIWKMQYCQIWVIYTHNGITGNGFEIFLNS